MANQQTRGHVTAKEGEGPHRLIAKAKPQLIDPDTTYPSETPNRVAMRKLMLAAAISSQAY
jgi:hypothetical protein